MPSIDENKPKARPGQSGRKAKQAGPKTEQRQRPKAARKQNESDRVEAAIVLNEATPEEPAALPAPVEIKPAAVASEPHAERALVPVSPSPVTVAGPVE